MNDACTRLTLDVQENRAPVVVKAKKSDTGRKLRITLADGGMPYEISSDCYGYCFQNSERERFVRTGQRDVAADHTVPKL